MSQEHQIQDLKDRIIIMERELYHMQQSMTKHNEENMRHFHRVREESQGHEIRIRVTEKYLWMGLGALAVLQVVLHFIK